MKKFTVCGAAVALCCLAGNVQAQEPEYPASASTEVFAVSYTHLTLPTNYTV